MRTTPGATRPESQIVVGAGTAGSRSRLGSRLGYLVTWTLLFLGIGAAVAALTYNYALGLPKLYRSETLLMVSHAATLGSQDASDALSASEHLATTYVQLLARPALLESAAASLGMTLSPRELAAIHKGLDVRSLGDTRLIALNLSDTNPTRGAQLLNQLVEELEVEIIGLRTERYTALRGNIESLLSGVGRLAAPTAAPGGVGAAPAGGSADAATAGPAASATPIGMSVGRLPTTAGQREVLEAELASLWGRELHDTHFVEVIEPAAPSSVVVWPRPRLMAATAGAFAAVIVALLALVSFRALARREQPA